MTTARADEDLFSLKGRVALVTGAAGHLGSAMAEALAERGAHVILNGRKGKDLETLAARLSARGLSASVEAFDVTDNAAVVSAVERMGKRFAKLHVLVNNAYAPEDGTMKSARPENFARAYSFVTAAFYLAQQTRPLLEAGADDTRGGASIINIASMYGLVSPTPAVYRNSGADDNPPFYGPSKAALIQLTRYMACYLGQRIRVNAISPGPFPKPEHLPPAFRDQLAQKTPMGRVGDANELRGPVVFLASDASSYVTGANLSVDGGWTAW